MGEDSRRQEEEEVNNLSVCGIIVTILGVMALIASASSTLKGDREYTYRAGIIITCVGLVMISLGERFI